MHLAGNLESLIKVSLFSQSHVAVNHGNLAVLILATNRIQVSDDTVFVNSFRVTLNVKNVLHWSSCVLSQPIVLNLCNVGGFRFFGGFGSFGRTGNTLSSLSSSISISSVTESGLADSKPCDTCVEVQFPPAFLLPVVELLAVKLAFLVFVGKSTLSFSNFPNISSSRYNS